jgi:type IV pilus assembly protein PilC
MLYYYAARTGMGNFVRGSLDSPDAATALAALRARALFVSVLEEAGTIRGILWEVFSARPLPAPVLAGFFRAFATLMRAGVPLARALPICVEGCQNKRLAETLRALQSSVEGGASLSEAMRRRPHEFPPLVIGTIRVGEHGAALDAVLDKLAASLERDVAVRKKVASALMYPGIVSLMTLAVLMLLLTTTIPAFANMYAQLRVPAPLVLGILLWLGDLLRAPGITVGGAAGVAIGIAGFVRFLKTARGAAAVESISLAMPVAGGLARKAGIARISRLLGMLLDCGVSLHSAVPMVASATEGPRFHASLVHLEQSLAEGSSIAPPLETTGLYLPLFLQMIRVGEETGQVGEMLARAASYYELDVENAVQQLGALLEPVMIVVLGGAVGLVAAAIFIPLYSLIGSIR